MPDIDPLRAIIGDEEAHALRSALLMLLTINPAAFDRAITELDRAATVGPLIDPTAWIGGERFENARKWQEILTALRTVRSHLPSLAVEEDPTDE